MPVIFPYVLIAKPQASYSENAGTKHAAPFRLIRVCVSDSPLAGRNYCREA
jgi:hypothetical protein